MSDAADCRPARAPVWAEGWLRVPTQHAPPAARPAAVVAPPIAAPPEVKPERKPWLPRPPRTWTAARKVHGEALWLAGMSAESILDAMNALPGWRILTAQTIHDYGVKFWGARLRARRPWQTPERIEAGKAMRLAGRPWRPVLAALRAMPGPAIPSECALLSYARQHSWPFVERPGRHPEKPPQLDPVAWGIETIDAVSALRWAKEHRSGTRVSEINAARSRLGLPTWRVVRGRGTHSPKEGAPAASGGAPGSRVAGRAGKAAGGAAP